jgi:hypothetical protein
MTPETIITEIAGTLPIAAILWIWLREERKDAGFWREKYIRLVERIMKLESTQSGERGV